MGLKCCITVWIFCTAILGCFPISLESVSSASASDSLSPTAAYASTSAAAFVSASAANSASPASSTASAVPNASTSLEGGETSTATVTTSAEDTTISTVETTSFTEETTSGAESTMSTLETATTEWTTSAAEWTTTTGWTTSSTEESTILEMTTSTIMTTTDGVTSLAEQTTTEPPTSTLETTTEWPTSTAEETTSTTDSSKSTLDTTSTEWPTSTAKETTTESPTSTLETTTEWPTSTAEETTSTTDSSKSTLDTTSTEWSTSTAEQTTTESPTSTPETTTEWSTSTAEQTTTESPTSTPETTTEWPTSTAEQTTTESPTSTPETTTEWPSSTAEETTATTDSSKSTLDTTTTEWSTSTAEQTTTESPTSTPETTTEWPTSTAEQTTTESPTSTPETTTELPTSTAKQTTTTVEGTTFTIMTTTEGTTSTTETLTTVWGTSAIEATTEGPTSTAEETTSTIEATSYDQTTFTAETSSIVETTNTIPTQMPTTTPLPINSPGVPTAVAISWSQANMSWVHETFPGQPWTYTVRVYLRLDEHFNHGRCYVRSIYNLQEKWVIIDGLLPGKYYDFHLRASVFGTWFYPDYSNLIQMPSHIPESPFKFVPEKLDLSVPENTSLGTELYNPILTGGFKDETHDYEFTLLMDGNGTFNLTENRAITLIRPLDYEVQRTRLILIQAHMINSSVNDSFNNIYYYDCSSFYATMEITVIVEDVDEYPMMFRYYSKSTTFGENLTTGLSDVNIPIHWVVVSSDTEVGTSIFRFTVMDPDGSPPAVTGFHITGNNSAQDFLGVTSEGEMYTTDTIPASTSVCPFGCAVQVYELLVTASQGSKEFECKVLLAVRNTRIRIEVQEDTSFVGFQIIDFVAAEGSSITDGSLSAYVNVSFPIHVIGYDLFLQSFNYEAEQAYHLLFNCTYENTSFITVPIVIQVVDVNDHSPVFDQDMYIGAVRNTTPANTTITTVSASDRDLGDNANLVYTITEGDQYFWVTDCGQLQTKTEMNFMQHPLQVIEGKVNVSDGLHSNETMVHVLVYALDLEYYIPENQTVGNIVVPNLCGNMSAYVYANCSVIDPTGTFAVHGDDLILDSSLDYEFNTTFTLLLNVVFDTIEMNITVTVHVLDVNDNWPFFIQQEIYTAVQNFTQENTTVAMVMAHDNDSNANLVYTITEGDHYFWVTDCGQLQTRMDMSLMPNPLQVIEGKVRVSDGVHSNETMVHVLVYALDLEYYIPENQSVGNIVVPYLCGNMSAYVYANCSVIDPTGTFAVHGDDLILDSRLDYEFNTTFTLLLNVVFDTIEMNITVTVHVLDVNDNWPFFIQQEIYTAVQNFTQENTTVAMVMAHDNDRNANLVYTITEGDHYFWVTDCGQLQTRMDMSLMPNPLQVIEGKVRVSDGVHSNETMVHVLVYALDLEYYIPENQSVGNIVVPYLCGNMSAYVYANCSVIDPTGTFAVHGDDLILDSSLDYEFNTTFTLLLNVVFDTIEMNITVTVHVLDVNDNWPFFIQQEIYTAVQNFTQENTTVAMVMAHDNDSNANLVYTITEGDHYFWVTDCGQLQIRMDMSLMPNPLQVIEGKVRVSDGVHSNETMVHVLVYALDLEYYIPENQSVGNIVVPYLCGNMSAYVYANCSVIDPTGTFAVHGDDLILDSRLDYEFNTTFTLLLNVVFDTIEMNITVTVHVLDVNDNWPFFIQQEIYTAVQNFTQENTTVAMVMAHDNDRNANLVYTITEGDHYFWVTDCGQLQTRMDMSLMPNPLQVIEGKVRVSDGVHSNETMVHVLVYALDLEYYIPENQSVGNIVVPYLCGNMSAYVYANCSVIDPTGTFAVHGDDLILDSSLDYEFNTTFTLLLNVVFDTIEMNITVTVHVLDVNDNWPFFIQQEIYTAVQNFTQENTTVAMVMAHDNDSNANLVYTITEGDHYFWVTDCGQLQTRMDMSLMPNPLQVIEGKVRVSDGVHSNETMVHVLVYALDLEYYIPENQSVGNIVVPYLCGNMSAYVYANCSVIDPTGTFAVHGDDLILDSSLDYEFNTTFTLLLNVVFVTFEMNITVTVHVLDVNDNWPFFIQQEIYTAVQNFTQENTTVAMVMAHDNDRNANLVYTITEGDHYFWVTDCGQLQTRMDMSLMPNPLQVIEGKVRVSDGVHSNETMVHVLVYALDLEYYIPENQSVGNIVVPYLCGNMSAYVYANCSVIDPTRTFAVHGDDLILDSRLDYEFNTTFTLLLIVSFDTIEINITVTVHVLDVNDNRPVFLQQQYSVTVMREINPHTLLTTITAEDPDQNQNITYKLLGSDNENFLINNYGQVFSLSSLNFSDSVVHTVNLTVRVTDGIWTSHASLKLHIVANELKIEVSESTPNESIVHSNLCSQEFLLNGTCSIAGMDSTFGLDVDKNLMLQRPLDFESKEDYDLMLTAVTGDLTWKLPIRVHVSDTNDEIPLFHNEANFFGIVSNSSLPNMTIFNINASDPDTVGSTLEFSLDDLGAEYFQISHCGQFQTMSSFPLQLQAPFHFVNFSISITDGIHVTTTRARVLISADSWQVAVAENDTENNWVLQNLCGNLNTYGGSCSVTSDPEIPGLLYNASENSLHLNTRLDARIQDVYEIKVQASLVPFGTISVSISINVIDVNDHVPQFTEDSYSAVLHNGAYENTVILTLEAEDGDLGNNSNIDYTITSNPFTIFGINSAGWLYTNRRLDIASILPDLNDLIAYTAQVTVEARDLGIPPKHNSTSVDVLFLDDEFVINIMENEYDIPFGNISVPALRKIELVGAPAGISANLTHLWLSEGLDYEQSSSLHFSLNLSLDHSHYIVPATVHVNNVNDEPPEFGESIYNFTVPDGARYYTLINMTTATDRDTTDITYSLRDVEDEVSGGMSVSGLFLVNEKNGALYTNGQISYKKLLKEKRFKSENDSYLEFMIEAKDGVFTANATIRVTVLKYDLSVVNQYNTTTAFLQEGNYSSTLFLVTDEAARANYSDFKFQVTPKQDELMFFINETTGFIYTNQTFDREQDDNYIVFVIALEQGLDSCQAAVIAVVNTTITDINDNPPVFTSQTYEGHVDENRTSAEVQFQMPIYAPDKDIGSNALIYYKLLNGTDVFQIDNTTGKLYTSGKLDREETGFYIVMISASDGTYNDTATVNITLDDVNDNAPEFSETNYTFNVSEDHSSDKSIGQVLAADRDINILPLTYHIENDSNEKFTMKNPFTGEIWISGTLDRESLQNDRIEFLVIVKDSSSGSTTDTSHSTTATVTVIVSDVNDNSPEFGKNIDVDVLENYTGPLTQVLATDPDAGENGTVTYWLGDHDNSRFSIDNTTGNITLEQSFDFEDENPNFIRLTVYARDNGKSCQSSGSCNDTMEVMITIKDINDNPPVFLIQNIILSSPDKIGIVIPMIAFDRDSKENGDVTYSFPDYPNNTLKRFFNVSNSGIISAIKIINIQLDTNNRVLTVMAKDNGSKPLSGFATITFFGQNEETPCKLNNEIYVSNITEEQHYPWPVISLTYNKSSEEDKCIFTLSCPQDFLVINSTTGEIGLRNGSLDREELDNFFKSTWDGKTLSCVVSFYVPDKPISAAEVLVNIKDINDNSPVFTSLSVNVDKVVNENFTGNIGSVTAEDADTGLNQVIRYNISVQHPPGHFSINQTTGLVEVIKPFDRDSMNNPNVTFTVLAIDGGNRSSSKIISLEIQDINDIAPVIFCVSCNGTQIELKENTTDEGVLLVVNSIDNDTTPGEVTYFLDTVAVGRGFVIDASGVTGNLTMNNNTFDYENDLDHFFNVTVYASDGVNVAQMEVALTLVDINDNAPIFNQTHYVFTMPAAAKSGYKIGSVYAKDMDSQSYVTYSISDTVSFAIDSSTGLITRAGSACIYGNVTFTVSATDGKYTSAAEVVISVTSENAYPPVFNQSVYSFTLDRIWLFSYHRSVIPSNITVKATDEDNLGTCNSFASSGNGDVTYKISDESDSRFYYMGGLLLIEKRFYSYDKPTISLTVEATDKAIKNRKTGTTTLVIKISNQKPVFNDSRKMVNLSANADVNTSVAEIEAVDKDENSTTHYTIVGGNSSYFKIDNHTGILQLKKELPQRNNDLYMTVEIEARDPVLEEVDDNLGFCGSKLDVIITIVQPNKNLHAPKFQTLNREDIFNKKYEVVYYSGTMGFIYVNATDGDDPSQPQGQLVYSLENRTNCHKSNDPDLSFVWNFTQNASTGTIQYHGDKTNLPVTCHLYLYVEDNGVVPESDKKTILLYINEELEPSTTIELPMTTEAGPICNLTNSTSTSSPQLQQECVNMAAVGTLAAVNGILIILLILSYWKTLKKCKKPSFKLKRETTFTPSEGDTGYDVNSMFPSGDYSYIKDVAPNPPPRPQFTLPKLKNPPGGKGIPLQTDDGDVNKSYLSLRAPDSSAEGYKHLVSKPKHSVYADRCGADEGGSASRVGSQISLQKEKHFVEDESWQRATYRQGSQSPGRQKTQTDPVTMSRPSKSGSSIGQTVVFSGPINITNISQPNRTAILPPLRQMPKMLDKHKQGGNDEKSADTSLEDGAPQGEAKSSIEAASEKLAEALSNKIENSQGEMWSIDQGHLHELSHGSKTILQNIYEKEFPGTKTKTVTDEIEHKPALDSSTIPLSSQPVKTGQGDHSLSHVEPQENDCKSDETIDDIDIEETEASQNGDSDPLPSYPSATRPNSSDVVTRRENQYDLPPKSGRLSIATHKPSQYEPNLVAPENNPPNCQEKPHPPRCFLENEKPQSPISFKENIGSSLESVNVPELENLRPGSASSTTFTVISDDGAVQYGKRRTSLASSEIDAHIPILEDSKTHTENSWKLKPKRKVAPSPSDPVHFEPGEAWNMSNLDIGKKGAGEEIFVHDEQDFEGASRPSYNDLEPDYEDNNHQPFGGETSYHSPDDGSIRAYVPQSSQDSVTPKKKKKKLKKKKSNSTEKKKKTPKVKSTEGFGEYTNQWESTF